MTKLFKNSKQALSFVLAFAVLAVSLFTGVVINSDAACADGNISYYSGNYDTTLNDGTTDGSGDGSSWEKAIIIDSADELAYLTRKAPLSETDKKYFKVADTVDTFVLQPEGTLNLNTLKNKANYTEVKEYYESLTGLKSWGSDGGIFNGNFDGNGTTVYGLYGNGTQVGLFTAVDGGNPGNDGSFENKDVDNTGITIKNIAVKNAYLSTSWRMGVIVAYSYSATSATLVDGTVNIEGCAVINCYMTNTDANKSNKGVFAGAMNGELVNIRNCYMEGNYTTATLRDSSGNPIGTANLDIVGGTTNRWVNNIKDGTRIYYCIENSIMLDSPLHDGTASYAKNHKDAYENVYTNMPFAITNSSSDNFIYADTDVKAITKDNIVGSAAVTNMPGLDWDKVWFANAGMPELRALHNISDEATKTENGHTVKCEDCNLVSVELEHTYGANNKCTACGADKVCGSTVIYWDGTSATAPTQTEPDGTIIIENAEQLAYVAKNGSAAGTSYKLADGIDTIIMQPAGSAAVTTDEDGNGVADILELNGYEETKAYFEKENMGFKNWVSNSGGANPFNGSFDGNGVTIYGVSYTNGDWKVTGLFPVVGAGATIKNIAVRNSYFSAMNSAGAVAGWICSTTAEENNFFTLDKVEVSNCWVYNTDAQDRDGIIGYRDKAGIVVGSSAWASGNKMAARISNVLVYGSKAINTDGFEQGAFASLNNELKVTDGSGNSYTNMIVLGALPFPRTQSNATNPTYAVYENVYTDNDLTTGANTASIYTDIITILESADDVKGANAAELELDWADTWFAVEGDLPTLREFHIGFAAATDNGDGTHSESCNCGLVGAAVAHTFDKAAADGKCTVCGGDCEHAEEDIAWVSNNNATCLTADTGHYECTACGLQDIEMENPDFVPGHKFKDVEAIPADCQDAGTIAHKLCEVCGNAFATTAADDEPIENALESTVDPIKDHTPKTDSDGEILYNMNETGHSKTCSVCNQEIDAEGHVGDYTYDADGHNGSCSVCKMATTGKENHTYVDGECTTCPYTCPHNEEDIVWVSNNDGACDKVDTGHYECSACKLQDVEMENPDFVATEHEWIDDGEPVDLGWSATATACKTVAQKCEKCGAAGPDREIGHSTGFWEAKMSWRDNAYVTTCETDGQHTEEYKCSDCSFVIETKIVTDPKTGHVFDEYEAQASTCTMPGNIAYKYCPVCNYSFAADAAYDESHENALEYDEVNLDLDPDNHVWAEYECTATCTDDGVKAHKFCTDCYLFIVDGETTDVTIDWAAFYAWDYEADEPIGIGAKLDAELPYIENELFAEYVAENYPDLGVEVPAYPEDTSDWNAKDAYYAEYYAVMDAIALEDENWSEAWYAYWGAILEELQTEAYHEALLEAAEAADVDMVAPADPEAHDWEEVEATDPTCEEPGCVAHKLCANCFLAIVGDKEVQIEIDFDAINPENFNSEEEWLEAVKEEVYAAYDEAGILIPAAHKLSEVKEVAATTEKTGTKAHYACSECDKLFADAEGKEEVTAEKLVIAKLVKEDDKASTNDKTEGDNSDKSPATGESVAAVAAVAALMGAAFVLVRKARKA